MECFIVGERYEAVGLQYAGKKFSFEISRKRSISSNIHRYFPVKLDKCKPNFPSHILSTDADIMTFVSRGVRCDQRLLLAWHFIFFVVEATTTAASTQPALLFSLERHDPVYNAATSSSSIPIRQSQIRNIQKKCNSTKKTNSHQTAKLRAEHRKSTFTEASPLRNSLSLSRDCRVICCSDIMPGVRVLAARVV